MFWGVSYQASEIFKKPEGVEFCSLALGRSREHFFFEPGRGSNFCGWYPGSRFLLVDTCMAVSVVIVF